MNLIALNRAIELLGARTKGELRSGKLTELVGLLGRYPDKTTAVAWKTHLKGVREELKLLAGGEQQETASSVPHESPSPQ